jgi:SAM-dependent methyltransferase
MKSESWYRSWFNSPYYHLLYQNRDETEAAAFIDQIMKYLKPAKDARFLDLACGKGRHSIYINKMGYDVTGADLSKTNIEYASAFSNEKLHFYVHDMRLPISLAKFDYVLNLFTSFGYFKNNDENISVLKASYQNLKSRGKILIDFLNVNVVSEALVPTEKKIIGDVSFNINRELKDGFITKFIHVHDGQNEYHYQEKVAALSKQDFSGMLSSVGFEILDIFGNYKLDQYVENKSPRLIIIARKTE